MDKRQQTGRQGEDIAAAYLADKNYTIITRNWRCATGELDIIAEDGPTLVFVEVRTRRGHNFGSAEESITYRKQQSIISTANFYLTQKKLWNMPCRFDVVAITPSAHPLKKYDVNWITSAFN